MGGVASTPAAEAGQRQSNPDAFDFFQLHFVVNADVHVRGPRLAWAAILRAFSTVPPLRTYSVIAVARKVWQQAAAVTPASHAPSLDHRPGILTEHPVFGEASFPIQRAEEGSTAFANQACRGSGTRRGIPRACGARASRDTFRLFRGAVTTACGRFRRGHRRSSSGWPRSGRSHRPWSRSGPGHGGRRPWSRRSCRTSLRVSAADSTGVLPLSMTSFGPRTDEAGLNGTTPPVVR